MPRVMAYREIGCAKQKKAKMVQLSNALTKEVTMVVKCCDAAIACAAVMRAKWPPLEPSQLAPSISALRWAGGSSFHILGAADPARVAPCEHEV